MAPFVLVHGSGQNASCWSRVSAALSARGHAVTAPDLPKLAPERSLTDFAALIGGSVASPDTIVVAHSFSGVFLPLIPEHRPCGLLVFLAAVIPEPGTSVREQFAADPAMFDPGWTAAGPRWFDPAQREGLAREFLFHDCDKQTLPWALSTLEIFDTRHLVTEPAPFSAWPGVPVASIVASGDRTLTPDWGRETTRRLLGRDALEIGTGHCPMVSWPDELADMLHALAGRP